ncbi:dicarboxylate/amino acid:cation symporter [Haematobacter massiliensis]|uniref:C4-dicarboxylate ABC transporter n=1 Tax=Haematobacter massiliensis TaxID=195105 RepID=A0A086XX92_9RHOB|nr:dicarboxylate/amino acid:cation symporter [Haematobacter massiliensis]KFI26642.1 C4-dicarboxylate ABC transporter [Haematobacter massiliensis]OWJ69471.1 dicarboxylate/amino acid:cation symporter [Haematobacter massiliensis]OWJ82747.1 dicarboxylate/amino acid:cation symporter [Haematobacter massiliensis]QBJ23869.1 dicarboxylate/amino acid:cation symporter [Haematobacter massiliensis]
MAGVTKPSGAAAGAGQKSDGRSHLALWIVAALVLGVAVGGWCHAQAADPEIAERIAGRFGIVTTIFLRLIKMIIAPLVLSTIVSGIASLGDAKAVGGLALRAMGWFVTASLVSLLIGLVMANIVRPGAGLNLSMPAGAAGVETNTLSLAQFFTHVFPDSIVAAMSENEVLQILVFSVFFGLAVGALPRERSAPIIALADAVAAAMFMVTGYVMRLAPLAVFAAMAAVVTVQGLGVLIDYGRFIGGFYLGLLLLWACLIGAGWLFLGASVFHLLSLLREPMLVAFSTASSEAAYPKTVSQLEAFGVSGRVTGFVLPLGYSFNLDGSMMYQTFAALFIAQAYGIDMTLEQQVIMLLVMMVASKGIAGVPRASLVVVAAVSPMFGLPAEGVLLILGIDQILDMGRTATNVIGNGLATATVARWQGELSPPESGDRTT